MRLLAYRLPEFSRAGACFATEPSYRSGDRDLGAGKPDVKHARVPAASRQRIRRRRPFIDLVQGLVGIEFERERRFRLWQRRALERRLENHAQRPQRAGDKPRDVESGDIFHHSPAKGQVVATAVE